jgi:predicted MFS family arabinose efflux permease
LISFVLAFFVKDWHLTFGQSGAILFASGVASIPGGIFFGWLGDKIGRRQVFMMMILTLCARGQLFLERQLFGRLSLHGRAMAGEVASQRLRSRLRLLEHRQIHRPRRSGGHRRRLELRRSAGHA